MSWNGGERPRAGRGRPSRRPPGGAPPDAGAIQGASGEKRPEEENPALKALASMETTHKSMLVLRQKVIIVGDASVGKTALTQMFHSGGHNFPKNYIMTIGCDFGVKMVTLPEEHGSVGVELYLFDTAGQSVFNQRQLAQKYWENASAVMAVYDVSNRDSFTSLNKWLNDVMTTRPGRPIPGVVVANKSDLRDVGRLAVSFEEGENFARQHGLAFKIASAMNAEEAEAPFRQIAQDAYKRYRESLDRVTRML